MRNTLRIGCRKESAHRRTFGNPHQHGAFRSNRLHDRAHVIHPPFEQRHAGHAIREALSALIKRYDTRERCQAAQKIRPAWNLVHELDVGNNSEDHNQIYRTVAHRLIGDADVSAAGITCGWKFQLTHALCLLPGREMTHAISNYEPAASFATSA